MISNEVMAKLIAARNTNQKFHEMASYYRNGAYIAIDYLFGIFRNESHYVIFEPSSRFSPSDDSIKRIEEFVLGELRNEADRLLATAEENFRNEISENIEL